MAMANLTEYHRPAGLEEALALLGRPSPHTVPLAGGTTLVAQQDPSVEAVVDLTGLGLDTLQADEGGLRLGAMLRIERLVSSIDGVGRAGNLLASVARHSLSWQGRLAATLGGTLMAGTCPELEAVLWSLNSQVWLLPAPRRALDLPAFISERARLAATCVLITEVSVPLLIPTAGLGMASVRRTPSDRAIAAVVACLERRGATCRGARLIAVSGAAPYRLHRAEQALAGQPWTPAVLEQATQAAEGSSIISGDFRGGSAYRQAMIAHCVGHALAQAWERATNGADA